MAERMARLFLTSFDIVRGVGISLHRSNPTCRDFEDRYRTNCGDIDCEWVPSTCIAVGCGCYRPTTAP
jgi:hypothetical protein